jgi:hypothetical protein
MKKAFSYLSFNTAVFLVFIVLHFIPQENQAQCFSSPGNPIGGTATMGTVTKNMVRTALFVKHSYTDRYFTESTVENDYDFIERAKYDYCGIVAGYGITERFTLETELGCFINKTQIVSSNGYVRKGYGLSNAVLSGKYNIINNTKKRFEWTIGIGGKLPLRASSQVINNVEHHIDVQPSTGSFGLVAQSFVIKENSFTGIRFFLVNRFEYYFPNSSEFFRNGVQYQFGASYYSSLIASKHLWFPWTKGDAAWTAIFQVRNETKQRRFENNVQVASSGSCLFYIVPQINITLYKRWNFSILYEFPVYQYYNGTQIGTNYGFLLNLTRDFGLKEEYED